jgi:hypothetical protein
MLFCLPKVHIQIAVEYSISLRRVKVPDKLSIDERRSRSHHLSIKQSVVDPVITIEQHCTYAIDPLRVKQ